MELFAIALSAEERDLILSRITVCGCLEKIKNAEDGKLKLSEIEVEELLDAIAEELENSDEDEEALNALCERLEKIFPED